MGKGWNKGHGKSKGLKGKQSRLPQEELDAAREVNMERSARDLPTKSPGSISRSKARSHARHLSLAESDARFRANSTPRPTPPAPPPSRRAQAEDVAEAPSDATQEWRSDQLSPWERRVKLRSSSDSSGHRREEVLSRNAAPLPISSSSNPGRPDAHAEVEDLTSLHDPASSPESSGWPLDNKASNEGSIVLREANPQTDRAASSGRNDAVAVDERRRADPQEVAFHFQGQWKAHRGKPKEPLHYLPVNLVMIHDITHSLHVRDTMDLTMLMFGRTRVAYVAESAPLVWKFSDESQAEEERISNIFPRLTAKVYWYGLVRIRLLWKGGEQVFPFYMSLQERCVPGVEVLTRFGAGSQSCFQFLCYMAIILAYLRAAGWTLRDLGPLNVAVSRTTANSPHPRLIFFDTNEWTWEGKEAKHSWTGFWSLVADFSPSRQGWLRDKLRHVGVYPRWCAETLLMECQPFWSHLSEQGIIDSGGPCFSDLR